MGADMQGITVKNNFADFVRNDANFLKLKPFIGIFLKKLITREFIFADFNNKPKKREMFVPVKLSPLKVPLLSYS